MSTMPVDDPFTTPDTSWPGGLLTFNSRLDPPPKLDYSPNGLSLMAAHSPTQLKRALVVRLEDVQKRLQEAGQLGESLERQKNDLQEKVKEVEAEAANGGEISPELREKLVVLEKEYNEVHKESTRALLSSKIHGGLDSPHRSAHGQSFSHSSPSKAAVPSRRQRNQPATSNDIEFATEIAQALIMEVRKLQAMLQDREETLKVLNEEKTNLEISAAYLESRIKRLEESENKYKEENWQLELVSQEKDTTINFQSDTVTKLQSQILALEEERDLYVRDIYELRHTQNKVNDDNEAVIRHHEGELAGLRRSLTSAESDRDTYMRAVEDLRLELEESQKTSLRLKHQNEELTANQQNNRDPFLESHDEDETPEGTPPTSPSKPTPRHGPLEAETLRSSLQHAHRMITKLKNDLNRERTEKSEIKRLLAEAKEKADDKRKEGSAPPSARKSRKDIFSDIKFKKPSKSNLLGANRKPKSEIISFQDRALEDADWEDEMPLQSPSPMSPSPVAPLTPLTRSLTCESYESGFETAQEPDSAFEVEHKSRMAEPVTPSQERPASTDELTGAEGASGSLGRQSLYYGIGSFVKDSNTSSPSNSARDRSSFISIGSEDDDDRPFRLGGYRNLDQDALQPREDFSPAAASQRLRLRIRNGGRGKLGRVPSDGSMFGLHRGYAMDSFESSPNQSFPATASQSPMSSMRPRGSISSVEMSRAGKSLFAELGGSFTENDGDETEQDTPSRSGFGSPLRRMIDASCNTEVPYPGTEQQVVTIPATPPPRPDVSESWTQSTPRNRPIMSESWTQSTPARRVTFAEYGTQATPPCKPTTSESATQFTPRPRAALFDSATHFAPISQAESITPPDRILKPAIVPIGAQTDESLKTFHVSSGIQFGGLPNLKPPSSDSGRLVPAPASTLSHTYSSIGVQPDEPKVETCSVGIQHDEPVKTVQTSSAGVQSEEIPVPVMVSLGTQSDIETSDTGVQSDKEERPDITEVGTQSSVETSDTGVQSDEEKKPEITDAGVQLDEVEKPEITDTGVQSDEEERPEITDTGVQSDEEERPEIIDTGVQSDEEEKPGITDIGVQSDEEEKPEITEVGTQSDEISASYISAGTQPDPETYPEEEYVSVAIKPEAAKNQMVTIGTQYDAGLPGANVLKIDSSTQSDPVEVMVPISITASSQTESEKQPPPPQLSISFLEIAQHEPLDIQEPIDFSEIVYQDTVPIDADTKVSSRPRALPPVPAIPSSTDSGISSEEDTPEGTPKKVSESIELSRERPITPPEYERPLSIGSISRGGRGEGRGITAIKGKEIHKPPVMVDQGVQTAITYESKDRFLKPVLAGTSLSSSNSPSPPFTVVHPPRSSSIQPTMSYEIGKGKGTIRMVENSPVLSRRPGSSNSNHSFTATYPPLPEDHRRAIVAAQHKGAGIAEPSTLMGPPLLPASAARNTNSLRPRTPVNNGTITTLPEESPASKGGTTPRPRQSQGTIRSNFVSPPSHRSSMSSFASELDDRFRINDDSLSQHHLQNDPRIIQAITQTMIGEYLWKYTRTATKSGLSSNRHRRFFWVHPYTRTLYWSEQDPSTAGKQELRAKSVSIEAVRVINDDNPMPPGLHRKSLVVITPGRTIQFTAPTGQRHETWYMALSYLLTRKMEEEGGEEIEEPEVSIDSGTTPERYNGPRAASSLSSYNNRASRQTSPLRNASSLSHRRPPPQTNPNPGSMSRLTRVFKSGSYTSKSSRHMNLSPAQALSMYDGSPGHDSVNDLRLDVEKDVDRMENVRACCDGKHDVGTLPRKGGLRAFKHRQTILSTHHTHAHTQQAPQPQFARTLHSNNPSHDQDLD